MWDERYSEEGYVYGTEPNGFLRAEAARLGGPVLSLAEGEGRNAVYLAGLGLGVTGVDRSAVGLAKAEALAASRGLALTTVQADLVAYCPPEGHFGAVVSIFAHLPPAVRAVLYPRVWRALRPGGIFLLEAYHPDNIGRGTGGPQDPALCATLADLRAAFAEGTELLGREVSREVVEGRYHRGLAAVVQFIVCKG